MMMLEMAHNVYRNEAVDATHLCEFHQVEGIYERKPLLLVYGLKANNDLGVIADYGLTLGGLMEFFETFFTKMGLTE